MKKKIIELEGITKQYGSIRALNDVSLVVRQGITGLLGPNGAGKSTLIKLLLGLVRFDKGNGKVLDFDIRTQGRKIRAEVGYLPEDDCYVAGMSGAEVVRFAACLAGMPETEGLRRTHEILDFCGMGQERYREIEKYSTGMRQKIKFAQAIVHDPQLLIFDEPTTGLDPEERDAMLNRIRLLSRKFGKTVILSTHILPDVRDVCDDVIIISRGQVKLSETMEVLNRPSEPSATLRIDGDESRFAQVLNDHNIPASADQHVVTIQTDHDRIPEQIWEIAKSNDVTILNLEPAMMSLDQIFMNAIQEGKQHARS